MKNDVVIQLVCRISQDTHLHIDEETTQRQLVCPIYLLLPYFVFLNLFLSIRLAFASN